MELGSNVKKYENKLEMKEIRKQIKGSTVIRVNPKAFSIPILTALTNAVRIGIVNPFGHLVDCMLLKL